MSNGTNVQGVQTHGFSRRDFVRFSCVLAAGSALPFTERTLAQSPAMNRVAPPDAVLINFNENPMGPASEALEAIYASSKIGGRYQDDQRELLKTTLAAQEGLKPEYVTVFPGSSDALLRVVLAYTSSDRAYVSADPTFEAGERTAYLNGAKVIKIPLSKTYAHDVRAMVAAAPYAGLFYVATPNNPTGTVTPLKDIKWLLANKPKGSVVLVDEAYIHIARNAEPATALVAADQDVIILRTFSKIYGMAGLRAGAALARPDLIAKVAMYGNGIMPAPGMAGAAASLNVKGLVELRRKAIIDIRDDTLEFLTRHNTPIIPSEANHFMMDVKRPGVEFIEAMQDQKVYIGRTWPIWPTHVRVTVGTRDDMEKFKAAYLKVNT
jgi:histidinol-phosphate/aromatic aminotransferase/cobyric acid decarboxylase-like protein